MCTSIPPHADAAWVGTSRSGSLLLRRELGGPQNDYTRRTATFMAWNLPHLARRPGDAGGIPALEMGGGLPFRSPESGLSLTHAAASPAVQSGCAKDPHLQSFIRFR